MAARGGFGESAAGERDSEWDASSSSFRSVTVGFKGNLFAGLAEAGRPRLTGPPRASMRVTSLERLRSDMPNH
mgnify:CR=1 FL=1